ncbi:MAG TPA: response regulator [Candidatus Polarisedimenticolaceae bacterium]|nr:response regulator [Candidatus Polarisedimenticolaceae bacterium]
MNAQVLVVEDEALIRWSLRQRLEAAGYGVLETDRASRVAELMGGNVDLVLLDLRLPDADGLDVLRAIRRDRPRCPVIVMTAYGTPEVERRAEELGALRVMSKPFSFDEMMGMVGSALGHACA